MTTNAQPITAEKFAEIYKSESLRNGIANAHKCLDKYHNFKHFQALHKLERFIVTPEQIQEAQNERERAKKEIIKNLSNKLVFVGMGCEYSERYDDDVCNHRIRTEITNPDGKKYFIEVGTWGEELTHFDFVIDRDLQNEYERKAEFWREKIKSAGGFGKLSQQHPYLLELKKYQEQPYYWNKKHLWKDLKIKYTKTNILEVVNMLFDCNFKEIEIDNFNLSTDDYTSISPKN